MGVMSQPSPLDAGTWAQIQREVSGQVAVGSYIVQIGSINGGVVTLAPLGPRAPQARPCPVSLRPRPFPGLLDRGTEIATATSTLLAGEPAEFHGEEGVGKTSLLHVLAHHPTTAAFRDGVVHLRAGDQPATDLVRALFDAFYDRDSAYIPTDMQVRHGLNDKQALVLYDDVQLARDEMEAVMDAAPACTFVIASRVRCLWGQGRSVALGGLPPDEALALLERELDRTLAHEERTAAAAICAAVGFHPQRLRQAAAHARERGLPLADLAHRLGAAKSAAVFVDETLPALPDVQRRILVVLAAMSGVPVATIHLAAIAGVPDPDSALAALEQQCYISHNSPYRAIGTAEASWPGLNLDAVRARALAHFASWAETNVRVPARLASDTEAVVWLLRWADAAGRWRDVVRLGRAIDGTLIVAGRWGIWESVLESVRRAARAHGDRADEAWALHQLGTRALCLGDVIVARADLSEALRLRAALDDRVGAAVTRHNLGFLLPPPGGAPARDLPRPPAPTAERPARRSTPWAKILAAIVLVAVLVGAGRYAWGDRDHHPVVTTTKTRTPASQPTTTVSPPTQTPTTGLLGDSSGDNGAQNPKPPLTTNGPTATATQTLDSPANLVVTLTVGRPKFQSDGPIILPFIVSSASDGDVGSYEIYVEALDNNGTTIEAIPESTGVVEGSIELENQWEGKKITVRAVADACLDKEANPDSCPVQDGNPDDNITQPFPVLIPVGAGSSPVPPPSDDVGVQHASQRRVSNPG